MRGRKPRAAPVFAHLLNGEIFGSVFALFVGTGDTFFAAPRAWMTVGSVRFSHQFLAQRISGYLSLRTVVCAGVKQRECASVRARLAAHSGCNLGEGSVSPSRCVFAPPRNGNAKLFSMAVCVPP